MCPPKPLAYCLWSYNAEKHWETKHSGVPMPAIFAEATTIPGTERVAVQTWASKSTAKRKAQMAAAEQEKQAAVRVRTLEHDKQKEAEQLGQGRRNAVAGAGPSAECLGAQNMEVCTE